jgi:hypothetical protein
LNETPAARAVVAGDLFKTADRRVPTIDTEAYHRDWAQFGPRPGVSSREELMITSVSKPQQALLLVLGRWQSRERGWRALLEDNHGTDHVLNQWNGRSQRRADHA